MPSVEYSEDLQRILRLPRRQISRVQAEADVKLLNPLVTTPAGKAAGACLLAWQAFCLRELYANRGGYFGLPVGNGKTLITWLAATVLDAQRPVLLIPASLREKTYHDFADLAKHFVTPAHPPKIVAFEELVGDDKLDWLTNYAADLYIIDEVDVLSNQDASVPKRIGRDVDSRMVETLCTTGTGTRQSILDFSHFLTWALKEGAPVPLDPAELAAWASALDAKKTRQRPFGVGCLHEIADARHVEGYADMTEQGKARAAFQIRLCETPGVVIVDDEECDKKITVNLICAPEDAHLNKLFTTLRQKQAAPSGRDVSDPLSMLQIDGQLGCGLELIWDPMPPEEWREARRNFAKFCRRMIDLSARRIRPLDTEGAVKRAYPNHPCVTEWVRLEPTFKPNSVPVWHSSSVVEWCARWAREHRGIIWVGTTEFGATLSQVTGLPYYGPKGLTQSGASILHADPKRSLIVSTHANRRGQNLQAWHENLVIGWPASARYVEQMLGRTHRRLQLHDVSFDVLLTSCLTLEAFNKTIREAQFVLATQAQTQKIIRSITTINRCVYPSEALRWGGEQAA